MVRGFIAAACAAIVGLGAMPALAQYPSKQITLVVPFAAGGSNDIVARAIGKGNGTQEGPGCIIMLAATGRGESRSEGNACFISAVLMCACGRKKPCEGFVLGGAVFQRGVDRNKGQA